MMSHHKLLHEVWEDFGDDGESLPGLCLAGPLGDDFRRLLGPKARLVATIEAGSNFKAMTLSYQLMGWGRYTTDQEWDFQPYPEEWFREQGWA